MEVFGSESFRLKLSNARLFLKPFVAAPGKTNFIDVSSVGKFPEQWDESPGFIDTILKLELRKSYEQGENPQIGYSKC